MEKKFNEQKGMSTVVTVVLVLAVAVAIGLVAYVFYNDNGGDVAMNDGGEMTEENKGSMEGGMIEDDHMSEDGDSMMQDDSMEGDKMEGNGGVMVEYEGNVIAGNTAKLIDFNQSDYEVALTSDDLIVLYFYANWCPICKEEVASALYPAFNELEGEDVIGFRVNFNDNETDDNEKELAREHGVAYQHTKVFVKNGQRVLKSPEGWDKERYFIEINNAR